MAAVREKARVGDAALTGEWSSRLIYDATSAAIAEFLRRKGVTKCPSAHATPGHGNLTAEDRERLRRHRDMLEQQETAKKKGWS
jgi:hypothetical protein